MRTRVKICGITRVEDAMAAARAGADAVGFVFEPKSPRHVSVDQARTIVRALPPFVTVVGLFVNAAPDNIEAVLNRVPLDLIQFHGNETPEQCRRYHRPYIKAIRMQADINLSEKAHLYNDAAGLLLDSFVADATGGTGQAFDWKRVPHDFPKSLILAGGLTPDNVALAIREARPFAVDVSSGVEQSKGIKDAGKITAFLDAVNQVSR